MKINVLFIGDNKSIGWKYCEEFETKNSVFTHTDNLSLARKKSLENKYDLVIFDLDFFNLDSGKIKEVSNTIERRCDTAFLFISAAAEETMIEKLTSQFPVFNFIQKPLNKIIFNLAIRNLLLLNQARNEVGRNEKRLEKKAIQAEVSYEDLYYSLPQEIILVDLEGKIITINRTGELSFGETAKKLLNRHFSESPFFKHVLESNSNLFDLVSILKTEGAPPSFKFRFQKKDKSILYTNLTCNVMVIEGKLHTQISLIDITERKEAQLKAEKNYNEILSFDLINRALLEGVSITEISNILLNTLDEQKDIKSSRIYLFDKQLNSLNLIADHLRGGVVTQLEQKIGIKIASIVPDLNAESIFKEIILSKKPFITSDQKEISEIISAHTSNLLLRKFTKWAKKLINSKTFGLLPLVTGDGLIGLLTFSSEKIFNEDETQRIIRYGIHATTVLEKKLKENILAESEERYRGLFEKMHEGLLVTNKEKLIMNVNKSFCKLTGYEEAEVQGKSGYELFHDEETRKRLLNKISEREKGNSEIYELEFITKPGKKIWTQVSSSPYYNHEGKFSGVVSIISDISQRKKHELQLQKTVDELNNRNNELMQFNYIVSHNIRSPIANILGLVNVAALPNTTAEEKIKVLDYIKNSALKMDGLIKDLTVILAARSTLNVKKENVSLHKVLASITSLLEKEINESETSIITEISADAKNLITIRSYIESILYNLISNAIKYKSPDRRPLIKIVTRKESESFVISFTDNGIGIDLEKHKSQLFGLYKRFNYDVEGKGLGLHMTKNQVQALGGEIHVKSILGQGTEFIVIFKTK